MRGLLISMVLTGGAFAAGAALAVDSPSGIAGAADRPALAAAALRGPAGAASASPAAAAVPPRSSTASPDPEASNVHVYGHGDRVDIEALVVKGKTTFVDFYSDFCLPCRMQGKLLAEALRSEPAIVLVKIDVNRPGVLGIDWQSPVSRQYGLLSLPNYRVYGLDGKLRAKDDDATEAVLGLLVDKGLWPRPDSAPPR